MKINSISELTINHASALSLIALLALITFITKHQVILTQKDSALIVNASGSLLTLVFLCLYILQPLANTLEEEQTQLERANQELNSLSSIDGLTSISNRRCSISSFINYGHK